MIHSQVPTKLHLLPPKCDPLHLLFLLLLLLLLQWHHIHPGQHHHHSHHQGEWHEQDQLLAQQAHREPKLLKTNSNFEKCK